MAEVSYTTQRITENAIVVKWEGLVNNDTGEPFVGEQYPDRSVQIEGTLDGATVTFEGSNNEGSNYRAYTDPQGNAIAKTVESIEAVTEIAALTRPRVSGAGGNASINIYMFARRVR